MRTTLTLDDQLAKSLQERAHLNRQTFKEVINEALSLGLIAMEQPPQPATYRLTPASMGRLRPGISLVKALELANEQEDAAIRQKLEMRK
jgi:hypothetical protein